MSKKLLFISPAFHGYWRSIAAAWEQLGYTVTTHCYDAYDTVGDKVRNKLLFELPEQLGKNEADAREQFATERACRAVEQARPDYTFVIKGDTLRPEFWDMVDQNGSKKLLWLYDELRRTRWTEEKLRQAGPIASYSHDDTNELRAAGFDAHFLPLAFDPDRPYQPVPSDELVFVGARYPKREAALLALIDHGVKVRAYGRDWSKHVADRVRTWTAGRPDVPSGRDLTLEEAWGRMAGAHSALNVHGDQDGFTMRTFEVAGVGGVQLVDRSEVSEFYEPGREVLAYTTLDELVEFAARAASDFRWGETIRDAGRRRTLAEHTFLHRMKEADQWWG